MASTPSAKSSPPATGPALKPMGHHEGKPAIRLSRPVYVIGSRSSCRIHLVSSSVSKAHALLVRSNGRTYIRDLASRSKVYLNGEETRETELNDGDLIKIGTFTFEYVAGPGEDRRRPPKHALPAKFEVSGVDLPVPIDERVLVLGRRSRCDIHLLEESVSTSHAVIFEMDGQRYVRDLGSRTGTYVNGVSTHQHMLSPHDTVRVGDNELRYVVSEAGFATVVEEDSTEVEIVSPEALLETGAPDDPSLQASPTNAPKGPAGVEQEPIPLEVEPLAPEESPVAGGTESLSIADLIVPKPVAEETKDLGPLAIDSEIPQEPAAETPAPIAQEPVAETASAEPESLSVADLIVQESVAQDTEEPDEAPVEPEIPIEPIAEVPAPIAEEPVEEPAPAEVETLSVADLIGTEPAVEDSAEPGAMVIEPEVPAEPTPNLELGIPAVEPEISADAQAPEPPAQDLELAPAVPEPLADFASPEDSALPLAGIDLSTKDETTPPVAAPEPELSLPPVNEPEPEHEHEPVLELSEPQNVEVSPPEAEAAQELPLEAVADAPEPLATLEATSSEELSLAPQALEKQEPAAIETAASELALDTTSSEAPEPFVPVGEDDAGLEFSPPPAQELSAEPNLPPEPAEVIDKTEPTPQSALQSSADELALDALAAPDLPLPPTTDELSDTQFDRAVRDFTGNELGELVESPPAEAATPIEDAEPADLVLPHDESAAPESTPAPVLEEPQFDLPELETAHDSVESRSVPTAETESSPEPELELPELEATAHEAASVSEPVVDLSEPADLLAALPPTEEPEAAPVADTPVAAIPELELPEPPVPAAAEPEAQAPAPVEQTPPPRKPAAPRPRVPWGANQDNFLGGTPLSLRQPSAPLAPPAPANERAVQDLISEIDQIAAKAEAVKNAPPAPPTGGEPPAVMPVLPPRPRRAAPRPQRRRQNPLIATEQTEPPPRDLVNTGFDGLANSPLRDMDVFSQPAPHAHDAAREPQPHDIHDPSASAPASAGPATGAEVATEPALEVAAPATARRPRVTPTLPDDGPSHIGQRRPQVSYAAEMTEAQAAAIRRRYHRRVYMLLLLMFGLIGATFWVINSYLGAKTTVEGALQYRNLQELTKFQQTEIQQRLLRILSDDGTRIAAKNAVLHQPEIGPGFLSEPEDYDRVIQHAEFSDNRPDLLVIRVVGHDSTRDIARISALLAAQYEHNKFLVDDAKRAQKALEDLNAAIERDAKELNRLNNDISFLRLIDESRPAPQQLNEMQASLAQLEAQADEAYRRVRMAEAELDQLKASPSGTPEPGDGGAIPVDDDKLRALMASLEELQKKLSDSRSAVTEQAGAARRELDAALDGFQQQVAAAQGMFNDNPALTAYIQDAQRLQETTRQLTDDLIRRQEAQVARLIELKERQNDRMEQRRIEIWQGDQQLRELTERLAIAERQYNAAVGGGLQREADDKRAEVELIRSMIRARQALLPGDSFFADVIRELQEVIDSTRKDIQEDRRRTEEALATRQQAFVSSQAIRNLPEEQKQVAAQLQAKLQQVTDARKQYNAAIDVGTTDGDSQVKSQIATLQAAIDARKAELAEANLKGMQAQQDQARQAAIQPKQQELERLKEAEAQASAAFVEKSRELREARARVTASAGNADKLSALLTEKDRIQRQRDANVAQLPNKKRDAATAVEPIAPTDRDITTRAGNDQRLLYMGISGASILLIFAVLIVLTLHAASVEAPAVSLQAADLRPDQQEAPQSSPKEATRADKADDGEDHEPATV